MSVYRGDRHNIVGLILTKSLIPIDPGLITFSDGTNSDFSNSDDKRTVSKLKKRRPLVVDPEITLFECFREFKKSRTHFALVSSHVDSINQAWDDERPIPKTVTWDGAITLEVCSHKISD